MRRRTTWLGLLCVLAVTPACRADLLSGTVSFNPATQLYTYSYTVTDTSSNGWLQEVDIRVGPTPGNTLANAAALVIAAPVATTSPAGWWFNTTLQPVSGFAGAGTYWSWFGGAGIAPGATLSGFSFTTLAPPAVLSTGGINYYAGFEYPPPLPLGWYGNPGQVVAPALSPAEITNAPAPEPSALLLGISALLVAACRVRRAVLFAPATA